MQDLNTLPLPELYTALTADGVTKQLMALARTEDLGPDNLDRTTDAMHIADERIRASVVARADGIISGLAAIGDLLEIFAPNTSCETRITDGDPIHPGLTIATLDGSAGEILALERTMLNLLSRLTGIATLTRRFVDAVAGTNAKILDTRKTTPGWRALEKYAVRCGGGHCHRIGLFDAVLIKDNHIALAAHGESDLRSIIQSAAGRANAIPGSAFIEVEVDTLKQLGAVLAIAPGLIDIVLLDNMDNTMLPRAIELRDATSPSTQLEASGGVSLDTIRGIAQTGVDRISAGALTHQAVSIDIALDIDGSSRSV